MNRLNNRGEAVLLVALLFTFMMGAATVVQQDRDHKKDVHYLKFHKESLNKQQAAEEALEKAKLFRI